LPRLNLPNQITLLRLLGSVLLFVLLSLGGSLEGIPPAALGWAQFVIFVLAAASDWLDGYLARRLQEVTAFGRIMDPFVDKILIAGALIILSTRSDLSPYLPPWVVALVVGRELFVTSLRGFMEAEGRTFPARWSGKFKMVIQCLFVGGLLLHLPLEKTAQNAPFWLHGGTLLLLWLTVLLTLYSGGLYLRTAWQTLSSRKH